MLEPGEGAICRGDWGGGRGEISKRSRRRHSGLATMDKMTNTSTGLATMDKMTNTSTGSETRFSFKEKCKGLEPFAVLLRTALSLAMIIIGSMHVYNCPVEPKIPIYLIVAGIFHLLALIQLKLVSEKVAYGIKGVLEIFSFAWFISGSVWVFRIYQDNPRGCNDLAYKFAFGILIFQYIFPVFLVAVICLFSCCAGLLSADSDIETPGRNHSSEDEEALN